MQKKLVKAVRASFTAHMQWQLPQFGISRPDGTWWEWTSRVADALIFFVVLQLFENRDTFTIEIAWSDEPKFPLYATLPWPIIKTDVPRGRLRLDTLWWQPGKREYLWAMVPRDPATDVFWRNIEARKQRGEKLDPRINPRPAMVEDLLFRVDPLVDDAIERLMRYGVPLFRQVAEGRGVVWNDPAR